MCVGNLSKLFLSNKSNLGRFWTFWSFPELKPTFFFPTAVFLLCWRRMEASGNPEVNCNREMKDVFRLFRSVICHDHLFQQVILFLHFSALWLKLQLLKKQTIRAFSRNERKHDQCCLKQRNILILLTVFGAQVLFFHRFYQSSTHPDG